MGKLVRNKTDTALGSHFQGVGSYGDASSPASCKIHGGYHRTVGVAAGHTDGAMLCKIVGFTQVFGCKVRCERLFSFVKCGGIGVPRGIISKGDM